MSYKDLLVVLDSEPSARQRIDFAAARSPSGSPRISSGSIRCRRHRCRSISAITTPRCSIRSSWSCGKGRARAAAKVREDFEHAAGFAGCPAEWREIPEGPDADPALHARYADLAILGQLDPDRAETEMIRPRPEQVALASGRPVLVVPYAGHFDDVGHGVVVAWNATREAARAVSDAMPLLSSAEMVTVLTIDPREGPHGHGELPGADIALHLARHGVKAQIERTVSAGMPVGEVLLSRARRPRRRLLVMGAYGHSRTREVLLGGATRSVLRSMTVPVLMSH